MAGYIRQSSFSDGDAILAEDFNNEFDALVEFSNASTGHSHSGTLGEGPVIGLIGDAGSANPLNKVVIDTGNDRVGISVNVSGTSVEQVRVQDGSILPVTTNDVDLGSATIQFKNLYIDGTGNIDSLTLSSGATVTAVLDEDAMTSNSATALATQQSIKAYVDSAVTGGVGSLGTMSTQDDTSVDINGGTITGITDLAVADGGTGASDATTARSNLSAAKSGANSDITSLTGLTTNLSVAQGGTGASTASAARTSLGAAASGANSDITSLSGLTTDLSIAQGGTGASTASAARVNILPTLTSNEGKILAVNTTANDVEWISAGGVGSVTSIAVSGGSTGLTTSGGPITSAGTITLAGTLEIDNGGTGSTTAAGARTALGVAKSGANTDITSLTGLTTAIAVVDGGTGSTTASGARSALGAAASGANSDITSLTGLTTDLSVAQGGTGASNAANARTNLGIGTIATQASSSVSITGGAISGVNINGSVIGGTTPAAGTFTAITTTNALGLRLNAASNPQIYFDDASSATNEGGWRQIAASNGFGISSINDAENDSRTALLISRSGVAIQDISYGNSFDLPSHSFSGNVYIASTAGGSSAVPTYITMGNDFSSTAGSAPKLRLYDDGSQMFGLGISSGSLDYIAPTSSTHTFYVAGANVSSINSTGIWTATNFSATSDERLKENWGNIEPGFVELLAGLKSGTFDFINKPDVGRQCGVGAQSLQEFLPEAVVEDQKTGELSVHYGNAAMVACVELAKEVMELKRQLFALTGGNV